jgi:hypothetical protein
MIRFSLVLLFLTARADWIDPDTPRERFRTEAYAPEDGREYRLVSVIAHDEGEPFLPFSLSSRSFRTSLKSLVEHFMTDAIRGGQRSIRTTVSDHSIYFAVLLSFSDIYLDTNAALHYYSNENAVTSNGVLNITTIEKINSYKAFNEKTKQFYADKKYIQSAMLQSWNKFCFIGGIVEFRAKLPGDPKIGGLWPACKYFVPCE